MIVEHVREVKKCQPCTVGEVVEHTQEFVQWSAEKWESNLQTQQAKMVNVGKDWTARHSISWTAGQHLRTEIYRTGKGLDAPDRIETEWWAVRKEDETVHLDLKVTAAQAVKIIYDLRL